MRYAARALRRNPGFTCAVVATLTLGIGMSTAAFSIANTLLFRALPYPNANRLVWLTNFSLRASWDVFTTNAEYFAWKAQAQSFERMTGGREPLRSCGERSFRSASGRRGGGPEGQRLDPE